MCGQEGDEAVRGPSATLRDSSQVECGNHSSSMLVGNLSLSDCLNARQRILSGIKSGAGRASKHGGIEGGDRRLSGAGRGRLGGSWWRRRLRGGCPGDCPGDGGAVGFAWDEFFEGELANQHTRNAYSRAVRDFLAVAEGETPQIGVEQARTLLKSIDVFSPVGLRDRAVLAVLVYPAARVGAASRARSRCATTSNSSCGSTSKPPGSPKADSSARRTARPRRSPRTP